MKAKLENGIVKTYQELPTAYMIGRTKINLKNASKEIQEREGFYDVTPAVVGANQEKVALLAGDLIDGKYVEQVRDLSQAEIDANALQVEEDAAVQSFRDRQQVGEQIINDTLAWMEKKLLASDIDQTVYDSTVDAVEDVLAPLRNGRLVKVKATLDGLSLTGAKEQLRLYILGLINTELGV